MPRKRGVEILQEQIISCVTQYFENQSRKNDQFLAQLNMYFDRIAGKNRQQPQGESSPATSLTSETSKSQHVAQPIRNISTTNQSGEAEATTVVDPALQAFFQAVKRDQ